MPKQKHLNDLSQIRDIMEKSTTFISLNGLSGVVAGCIGLLAGLSIYIRFHTLTYSKQTMDQFFGNSDSLIFFALLMPGILALSIICSFILSAGKARRQKIPIWNNSSRNFAESLFIPLICGGLLIGAFILNQNYEYIFSSMLIFFGTALFNASKYSRDEIKALGMLEMLLGISAAFWLEGGIILWLAGFGLLNIVYGILMYLKYER